MMQRSSEKHSPRVIICHPNSQHSYHLAVGAQKAGLLEAYVTQLYYDEKKFPFSLIKYLPGSLQRKARLLLSGRRLAALDDDKVIATNPWAELVFIFLNRAHIARRFRERWLLRSAAHFSLQAGKIASERADILIGTDGASRDAFHVARQKGVLCILDVSYPHVLTSIRILDEEAKLHPEFAESIDFMRKDNFQYSVDEVKAADVFFVGSSFPKQTLIENDVDPERIFVIPYGADLQNFKPVPPRTDADTLRLLFAGRIGQRKGITYLLEAVRQLREQNYNIQLLLAGTMLPNEAVYEPYRKHFTYLGLVPYARMPEIYQQADVFVFPSLLEGLPRAGIEAMACGLPIIASTNTGVGDAITDGVEGFIVPIRDVEILKERILYFYHQPEKRIEMSIAAHKAASKYSWERYYNQVGDVLKDIWQNQAAYRQPANFTKSTT